MLVPVVTAVEGHGNESVAVTLGGADKASAAAHGIACFPADAGGIGAEQTVVVVQRARVIRLFSFREGDLYCRGGPYFLESFIFHTVIGKDGKIFCGGVVLFAVKTVGVFKVGIHKSQLRRLAVHEKGKALDAACDMQGNGSCRIVGALQKQGIQKGMKGKLFSFLQITAGALNTHRLLWNGHDLVRTAMLQGNDGGHDLGGACHGKALFSVVGKQHGIGVGVV